MNTRFVVLRWELSIISKYQRNNPDPQAISCADEPNGAKSGKTASPFQVEAEKEKKKNV